MIQLNKLGPAKVNRTSAGYKITGTAVAHRKRFRVTALLNSLPNPELQRWRQRVGEAKARQVMETARDRGTAFHDAMEARLLRRPSPLERGDPHDVSGMVEHAIQWLRDEGWRPLEVEMVMWSDTIPVAGTCDLWAINTAGRTALIDWKTSRNIYETHALQLVIYKTMERAMAGREGDPDTLAGGLGEVIEWSGDDFVDDLIVVQVDPTGVKPHTVRADAIEGLRKFAQVGYQALWWAENRSNWPLWEENR